MSLQLDHMILPVGELEASIEFFTNILGCTYEGVSEPFSVIRVGVVGGRIVRITAGPDGKGAKQEVFASGWIEGDQGYLGRPDDIILAKDGSILVADDWAGAVYRISYSK